MRYFSLGNITFTDANGGLIRDFNPNEFELLGGYAFKLSDRVQQASMVSLFIQI